VEQASKDQFGLKVKLPNGNVASRVLPIRIHDLDNDDIKLCESVLGGLLRSIDFIYQSAGVNRPLRANEDHPQDNIYKTYYRDQINKVANSIKEIVSAISQHKQKPEEVSEKTFASVSVPLKRRQTTIMAGSLIALALIILGILFVPKLFKPQGQYEKSIAVLPFRNDSPDEENQYFINGTMETILDNLCKIEDLKVISRTSVEQYRNTSKSSPQIAEELNVRYILEGSGQKYGDDIKLTVQLIDAVNDKHIWSSPYERKFNDIFVIQSEIAQTIASEIKAIITPEEKKLIEKIPTSNLTAYDLYLKANDYQKDYQKTHNLSSYQTAVNLYKAALETDSAFAKAYSGLASAYYDRYYWLDYFKENFMDSCLILANKALSLDDKLDEAYFIKGLYYQQIGHIKEALDNYDKALKINPNYYTAYLFKGSILVLVIHDFVKGLECGQKALNLVHGNERPSALESVGYAFLFVGFPDKAKYYYQEALKLDGDSANYFYNLSWLELSLENFEEAFIFSKRANEIDSTYLPDISCCSIEGHEEEAYLLAEKYVEYYKKTGEFILHSSHRIGYAFWQAGKHKEAEYYFNQQIKYDEESIKLGRDIAQSKVAYYDLAGTYAFLGDKTKAYQCLDEFDKMNFYQLWLISYAKHDPLFGSIRNEERFQKILQNMEAKYQAEHERVKKWIKEQGML
jgi:TolB-like protein/Tfp pilus assembly protein PilF